MFRFVEKNNLSSVLCIGYDHSKINQKVRLAEETNEKQFTQGLTIEPYNNHIIIYVPNGKIYSLI